MHDVCPRVEDPGQEDSDGDGIGDACTGELAPPRPGELVINEVLPGPDGQMAFVEIVTLGSAPVSLDGVRLTVRGAIGEAGREVHVFDAGTRVPTGWALLLVGQRMEEELPGVIQVEGPDALPLPEHGILAALAGEVTLAELAYPETAAGVSRVRSPEFAGDPVAHDGVHGAEGRTASPGRRSDGTVF